MGESDRFISYYTLCSASYSDGTTFINSYESTDSRSIKRDSEFSRCRFQQFIGSDYRQTYRTARIGTDCIRFKESSTRLSTILIELT